MSIEPSERTSEQEPNSGNEPPPTRDDLEEAIFAADDTGMLGSEADIANAQDRRPIGTPHDPTD